MKPRKKPADGPPWSAPYTKIRAEIYVILASLLGQPPSENLLKVLRNLQWDGPIPENFHRRLEALCKASRDYPLAALKEEYDRLFVGLGCGEMIPYASWYREKKIQSSSLASLRSDLIPLGIVKRAENLDSEDHAASLCECMALISRKPGEKDYVTQARFFRQHVQPWMTTFFRDLESAKNAGFYRTLGAFGLCFLESEIEYLK